MGFVLVDLRGCCGHVDCTDGRECDLLRDMSGWMCSFVRGESGSLRKAGERLQNLLYTRVLVRVNTSIGFSWNEGFMIAM